MFQGGVCVDEIARFLCECPPGFTGPRCETEIIECESNPCQNGALCVEGINRYECRCLPGFEGVTCEININECASQPCRNNGRFAHLKSYHMYVFLLLHDNYVADTVCPICIKTLEKDNISPLL